MVRAVVPPSRRLIPRLLLRGGRRRRRRVATALGECELAVEDLSLRQPTLDEVFLTLTGKPVDDESDLQEAS